MRIAIIGAGVSGLTAYLFLVKHLPRLAESSPSHEYVIYESHEISKRKKCEGSFEIPLVGAGLGIAANGMNILHDLDKELHAEIQGLGFPAHSIGFRNSRGWALGSSNVTRDDDDHVDGMVMISRENVLDCLLKRIPDGIIKHKSVSSVIDSKDDQLATISFNDGSSEKFDLVIGADGVWSKTRHAILGDKYPPYYTGLFGVGGFVPSSILEKHRSSSKDDPSSPQVIMTFSGNGFFGYAPSSSDSRPASEAQLRGKEYIKPGPQSLWWSSFESENSDTRSTDPNEMRKLLLERHKDWADPIVHSIIESPDTELRSVATWVSPKSPTWAGQRVVLIGDAAHALPSSSGQGISQSMLDSQALSLLLAHHLKRIHDGKQASEEESLKMTLRQYVQIRKQPVEEILDAANKMGDRKKKSSGFIEEMVMYAILKILFSFSGNSITRAVFKYNVKDEVEKVVS